MTRAGWSTKDRGAVSRSAAALVIALAVIAAAAWSFRRVMVCDTVKGPKPGEVVETCRHLQATDPPALAVGVLALLALAIIANLNEIVVLGIGMKRNLEDAKAAKISAEAAATSAGQAQVEAEAAANSAETAATSARQAQAGTEAASREATAAADSAQSAKDHARGAASSAAQTEALVQAFQRLQASREFSGPREPAQASNVEERASELASRYMEIRKASPGYSPQRSMAMTEAVAEMIDLFSSVDPEAGKVVTPWLGKPEDEDGGKRLAAYAYLYTHPDPPLTGRLARSALTDGKPFTEYWALQALRRQIEAHNELDGKTRQELEARLKVVGSYTDRGHEIVEILRLTGSNVP